MHFRIFRLTCLLALFVWGWGDIWAQQYKWAKQFASTGASLTHTIAVDGDQNVVLLGESNSTIDLDPGPGTFNVFPAQNFIVKLDSNGTFLWGGSFVGTLSPRGVVSDAAGNLYITGQIQGQVDFDFGPGMDTMGPPFGHLGTYFARYSASGQYLGAKVLDDVTSELEPAGVLSIDDQANLYFLGGHSASVDVDLGPGVHTLPCVGFSDIFLSKYDSAFGLQWVIPLSGTTDDRGQNVRVTPDKVYVLGMVLGQVDVDPGPGTTLLTNTSGPGDLYVAAYTHAGAFLWADKWDCSDYGINGSVQANAAGHVVVGMRYEGTLDLDPSANLQLSTGLGGGDVVVIRLDSNGTFLWGERIGCKVRDELGGLRVGPTGMIYLMPLFQDTIDVDPGLGQRIMTVPSINNTDAAIVKFNPSGQMIWAAEVDGPGYEWFYELEIDQDENIYFLGELQQTVDFNPSPGGTANLTSAGLRNGFVAKWGQTACTNFLLVIDSVANGTCQNLASYMAGTASAGTAPYAYQWNTSPITLDSVATTTVSGIYSLTVVDALGCQQDRSVLVAGPSTQGGFDLSSNMVTGPFRPGIATTVTLDAFNRGCIPVSGQLKLALDPLVAYQSAVPAPTTVTADTLFWNTPTMTYDSAHFLVQVILFTDTSAQTSDSIHLGLVITPIAGDQNPGDNVRNDYAFPVVNSFDPNMKHVHPSGQCEEHYVRKDVALTYTVQFQNTGTAEALEVAIQDSLDPALDLATLKVVAASHPMITEILPGNVLRFLFHDIHLPDSNSNEPASHGYVIYEITANSAIASGTQVVNAADIYFDFNPAVRTNATVNTMVDVIPACVVGIAPSGEAAQVEFHPNPAGGLLHLRIPDGLQTVAIVNLLGQTVWHQPTTALPNSLSNGATEFLLDVSAWPAGLYLVTGGTEPQRLIVGH